jgi:sulfate adenylyltransferase subunit 2
MTRLSHLDVLEAESIYILREVAAGFTRPAMLYSIGKDSSVLLRLAEKAFYPGKIPSRCCTSILPTSSAK